MKRRIFFILVLLCTLSGYAQISVGRDSLVIDPLKMNSCKKLMKTDCIKS